ncbi:UNVERIFIED_CONTAM: hypothetical protein GTU68_031271 [Idotea baltica]|nr:hypothetical protein [Idotea baltica]
MEALREIILDCGLTEDFKWRNPCYEYQNKNILIIGGLKAYCCISFFKGALLHDSKGVLVQQTENMQSVRQIRFTNIAEIEALKPTIKAYIYEAIEVEKAELRVIKKKTTDFEMPDELTQTFQKEPEFKKAFTNLTAGRQRGYLLHFSKPKQSKTRTALIKKNRTRIFDGYGLNDCTCGLSKRGSNCDGSHKQLEKK